MGPDPDGPDKALMSPPPPPEVAVFAPAFCRRMKNNRSGCARVKLGFENSTVREDIQLDQHVCDRTRIVE